jgi:hypothetical protein
MKVITEEDATKLKGHVVACKDRPLRKKAAERIAKSEAPKWHGSPLLCEYVVESKTGRKVKRYLPLVQYTTRKD